MSGSKTEQPTSKRMHDARKKGRVAKSMHFTNAAVACLIVVFAGVITDELIATFQTSLNDIVMTDFFSKKETRDILCHVKSMLTDVMLISGILLLPTFILTVLVVFLQIGPLAVKIKFDPSVMNPASGLKRMLSKDKLYELVFNIVIIFSVGLIGCMVTKKFTHEIFTVTQRGIISVIPLLGALLKNFALCSSAVLVAGGLADYLHHRKKWKKDLMMSKDEVKNEYKEMEGDPHIKGMRRQLQLEMAFYSQEREVRDSAVVLVNPLRYAVALKYKEDKMSVPVIAAKGAYKSAARIRKFAQTAGIPIIRNPVLAKSLFKIEEGKAITEELYEVVAEVLFFIESISFDDSESQESSRHIESQQ